MVVNWNLVDVVAMNRVDVEGSMDDVMFAEKEIFSILSEHKAQREYMFYNLFASS